MSVENEIQTLTEAVDALIEVVGFKQTQLDTAVQAVERAAAEVQAVTGVLFDSVALGLSATVEGQQFRVRSYEDDIASYRYVQESDGSATLLEAIPSAGALADATEAAGEIGEKTERAETAAGKAEGDAARAEEAANRAAMYVDLNIDTVSDLLADTILTYSATPGPSQIRVYPGDMVRIRQTNITMVIAPALSSLAYLSSTGNGVLFHPAPGTSPVMPEYWGGENIHEADGVNATRFCQRLAAFVNAGLSSKITLSRGADYIVHGQDAGPVSGQPYYRTWGNVFHFIGRPGLDFDLAGAKLKTAPGLRYGSFHPDTGLRHDAPAGGFTNSRYAASIGRTIRFENCTFPRLYGGELDGSMDDIIVGGYWGDLGIQLSHAGFDFFRSSMFSAEDIISSNFGLDGSYITHEAGQRLNGYFRNVRCYRNGRQGLSWTGGWGMLFEFCEFNDTGTGAIASAPRAGVDMEHNGQLVGDGVYRFCKMLNNGGVDYLYPQTNPCGTIVFEDCEIGSPRTAERPATRSLWIEGPGHRFRNCKIVGNCVNLHRDTQFDRTLFTSEGFTITALLLDISTAITLRNCEIHLHYPTGVSYAANLRGGVKLFNTVFRFFATDPTPRGRLLYIGTEMDHCEFIQEFAYTSPEAKAAVETAGEYCFIDTSNEHAVTSAKLVGGGVAWASRTGQRNITITQTTASYIGKERFSGEYLVHRGNIPLVDNGDGTFDLPLGVSQGGELTTISDGSINGIGTLMRISGSSAADTNHRGQWLFKSFSALGMTVEPEFRRLGSQDAVRFTQGSVSLAGKSFSVKAIPLGASNSSTRSLNNDRLIQ